VEGLTLLFSAANNPFDFLAPRGCDVFIDIHPLNMPVIM
jgi:hypothetical protein